MKRIILLCIIASLALPGCIRKTEDMNPEYLREGDTVIVFSPSATPSRQQVEKTVNGLKEWGYVPVCSKHVCDSVRTLQDCYDDVVWALNHPTAKALFCVRGGYASSEVMDMIPLDMIRRNPKLLIGFSDITAMHSAWIKAGLTTIHGSMAGAFSLPEECMEAEKNMLRGIMPEYTFEGSEFNHEGEAEGILIGGNISILQMTLHTAYDITSKQDKPYIIMLEDIGGTWQNTHNLLTLLYHMGVLQRAKAILYGEWTDMVNNFDDYSGNSRGGEFQSMEELIHRQFGDLVDVPTAYSLPFGHDKYNFPFRLGGPVKVNISKEKVNINFLDNE